MAKYHISKTGEPGLCKAVKGNCPFGNDDEHYTSAEAARIAFEEGQDGSFEELPNFAPTPAAVKYLKVGDVISLRHLHSQTRPDMEKWEHSRAWPERVTVLDVRPTEETGPNGMSYIEVTTEAGVINVLENDSVSRDDKVGKKTKKLQETIESNALWAKSPAARAGRDQYETPAISVGKDQWGNRISVTSRITTGANQALIPELRITEIAKGTRTPKIGYLSRLDPQHQEFPGSSMDKEDQEKLFIYALDANRAGVLTLEEASERTQEIIPILEKLNQSN